MTKIETPRKMKCVPHSLRPGELYLQGFNMTRIPAQDQDDGAPDPCATAYDDGLTFNLSEMEAEFCDKSTSGQCEYTMEDGFTCCKHCGKRSEI